jgi:predicted acetyltransferase
MEFRELKSPQFSGIQQTSDSGQLSDTSASLTKRLISMQTELVKDANSVISPEAQDTGFTQESAMFHSTSYPEFRKEMESIFGSRLGLDSEKYEPIIVKEKIPIYETVETKKTSVVEWTEIDITNNPMAAWNVELDYCNNNGYSTGTEKTSVIVVDTSGDGKPGLNSGSITSDDRVNENYMRFDMNPDAVTYNGRATDDHNGRITKAHPDGVWGYFDGDGQADYYWDPMPQEKSDGLAPVEDITRRDAFLVDDISGDGIINDRTELIGLAELKEKYNKNKDNIVSGDELNNLKLWQDNGNGVTEEGELTTLEQAGYSSVSIDENQGTIQFYKETRKTDTTLDEEVETSSQTKYVGEQEVEKVVGYKRVVGPVKLGMDSHPSVLDLSGKKQNVDEILNS